MCFVEGGDEDFTVLEEKLHLVHLGENSVTVEMKKGQMIAFSNATHYYHCASPWQIWRPSLDLLNTVRVRRGVLLFD